MIPKTSHYCWFGGKPLPYAARKCLKSWKKQCPDFEIKRWDETNFDVNQHPFVKSAYEAKAWAFVSDWARLKIVYDEGGVYLDTDIELIKPLGPLLENNECYIGVQQSERLCTTGLGFGAVKASPVIEKMLSMYNGLVFTWEKASELVCPKLNDAVVRSLGFDGDGSGDVAHLDGLTVYPCRYLDPVAPGDLRNLTHDDTVSISLYANSWGGAVTRFKRMIISVVGCERVDRLKRRFSRVE